jgi:hypothetical protein
VSPPFGYTHTTKERYRRGKIGKQQKSPASQTFSRKDDVISLFLRCTHT